MWDFWSLSPESLHQVTILFSDRGLPASLRHIDGFGSHTYSLVNAAGERHWVKFHFKTQQGIRNWSNEEAAKVIGEVARDPTSERSLRARSSARDFPSWDDLHPGRCPKLDRGQARRTIPFDLTQVLAARAITRCSRSACSS
jgi:catalase